MTTMDGSAVAEWLSDLHVNSNDTNVGRIPLQKSWTFWFFKPALSTSDDPEAYTKQLQRLDDFTSVQDFWACYNALPAPQTLQHRHCFHLMKTGVKPEWEDPENRNGGTWTFRVEKNSSGEVWRQFLLAAIGEQFTSVLPSDDICGITVKGAAPSAQQLIFQVWHKDDANKDKVAEKLKEIVAGSAELTGMFYKSNAEELSKAAQQPK